jgi:hypothetical protein
MFKASILAAAALAVIGLSSSPARAQQEKGNKEVLFFSGGFVIGVGETSGNSSLSLGGTGGYFLTRKNEVGVGTTFSVNRFRGCIRVIDSNGNIAGEECNSSTFYSLGFLGFYRYNFAAKDAIGFPVGGVEVSVADVTDNFTGNFRIRPFIGYKYYAKKNVAIDITAGYSADLNKVEIRDFPFLDRGRVGRIDGRVGLAFLF